MGLVVSIVLVLALGVLGGFYFFVVGTLKSSQPYKLSVQFIEKNATVQKSVGPNFKLGWFPKGKVRLNTKSGHTSITLKITGEKSKGKVWTSFQYDQGQWSLSDAVLFLSERPNEAIPLLQIEITDMTFYEDKESGPVSEERIYEKGEKIYWTVSVTKAHKKEGKVFLKEGLIILDKEGKAILENPELIVFNEASPSPLVKFTNDAALSDAGEFTIRATITDQFSNQQVSREEKVQVVHSKSLKVSGLTFHDDGASHEAKTEPIFQLGESVFITFEVVGFKSHGGKISLIEDLYVLDDKGKEVLKEPSILKIDESWQADDLLTLRNKIDVPVVGKYKLKIVVHDKNTNQECSNASEFIIKGEEED